MAWETWGLFGILALFIVFIIYLVLKPQSKQMEIKLDKAEFLPGESITGAIILHLKDDIRAKSLDAGLYDDDENDSGGTYINSVRKNSTVISPARIFKDGETFPFTLQMDKKMLDYLHGQSNPPPLDNQVERLKYDIIYRVPRSWFVEARLSAGTSGISQIEKIRIILGKNKEKQ